MRTSHRGRLLLTTTSSLDGWEITDYIGPVSAQFVIGTGLFADFFSGWTDLFGAHSRSYQNKLDRIHEEALDLIAEKALKLRANVVLGLRVDHDEIAGAGKSMLMVTATGTAARGQQMVKPVPVAAAPQGSVSAHEMRTAVSRRRAIDRAREGTLDWSNDQVWRFVVDNQVHQVADWVIENVRARLGTMSYDPTPKQRFQEYFSAVPRDVAQESLYGALGKSYGVAALALEMIAQLDLLDLGRLVELHEGGEKVAASRSLTALQADQPMYDAGDISLMRQLLVHLSNYSEIPITEKRGLIGARKFWPCGCGVEVNENLERCPTCRRDRWAIEEGFLNPPAAAGILHARLDALREQLLGIAQERPPGSGL